MKRFRLSTLLLLDVIAALAAALVVQERRAARREAALLAELQRQAQNVKLYREVANMRVKKVRSEMERMQSLSGGGGTGHDGK